ncbi:hypothetical protein SELMODRAFT_431202 [Selaginella moellendorffii]|uniref:SHSP domain-containing protein n=1 Tax=Selaginella moellendorffii TaxID=88036 RepID=D8TBV2_SELML|nr:hypothetical protein SELMODRAFT_431202 [Selaginella moellendorffii]
MSRAHSPVPLFGFYEGSFVRVCLVQLDAVRHVTSSASYVMLLLVVWELHSHHSQTGPAAMRYDERKLLWSSFENQQFYTVDVQVPGLSSLDQVHVEKHGRGVLVSTEKDDEILTIRLPKMVAALEGTASTVPTEDCDEAELDMTTSKRLKAAIIDDKHHVKVPGSDCGQYRAGTRR